MQVSMKDLEKLTLGEMEDLLAVSRKITWTSEDKEAKYNFIGAVLKQHSYSKHSRRAWGGAAISRKGGRPQPGANSESRRTEGILSSAAIAVFSSGSFLIGMLLYDLLLLACHNAMAQG